jgi:ankyrin repeat protein
MRVLLLLLLLAPTVAAQIPPPDSLDARWARAVRDDDRPAADALLTWGVAPSMPGDAPLYRAARAGRADLAGHLLAAGADPDTRSPRRGTSALDAAVYFGHEAVVRRLLEAGADPTARGPIGFAAFDWALEGGQDALLHRIATYLAERGTGHDQASFNLLIAVVADDADAVGRWLATGRSPDLPNAARYPALALAARLGRNALVDRLLAAGADPDIGDVALDEASPLHQAARGGQPAIARRLLAAGADPNKRNARGFTALHLAALYDRPAVAGVLLDAGTDPAVRSVDPDPAIGEYTAFDFAVEQGRPVVADTLLGRGSDPSDRLAQAALRGDAEAIRRWLSDGADPNKASTPGVPPLTLAARFGHVEAVRLLLDGGADPDRRSADRYSATALMRAAQGGHVDIVDVLLRAGADADRRDRYGSTALAWAAQVSASDVVERLLAAGASRSIRGIGGRTPADAARAAGDAALARRLAPEN